VDEPRDRARPWIAVVASATVHALIGAALWIRGTAPVAGAPGQPFTIDVDIAPEPRAAEVLPPEALARAERVRPDEVQVPEPPPPVEPAPVADEATVPEEPKPPRDRRPSPDAGVAPEPTSEPRDAGADDPGADVRDDAARDPDPAIAGTAINLLALFPSDQVVSLVLRFDRLRGTKWAVVAQDVLRVMPDYDTLVADPDIVLADALDLIAVSSASPRDAGATLLAVKAKLTQPQLRDFLDEKGAHVTWSRVSGGVMGKRHAGARVRRGDKRVFLAPYGRWMVLARASDLPGMLDPVADTELDGAAADETTMPGWLKQLDGIEDVTGGSGDGPVIAITIGPRSKVWQLPDVGLGVDQLPAPERVTLLLELDAKTGGFHVHGHLRFRDAADATTFVEALTTVRQSVVDNAVMTAVLKKVKALNAVNGLSLKQTDRRVAYSTSISAADARVLFAAGTESLGEYFAEQERKARRKREPPPEPEAGPEPTGAPEPEAGDAGPATAP
jgi:hypothetical protein